MTLIDVLGSDQRLRIIRELSEGPMYVTELADSVGMNGKSAVHHLTVLENAGVVDHYWNGNRKYHRLVSDIELHVSPPPERRFVLQADGKSTSGLAGDE